MMNAHTKPDATVDMIRIVTEPDDDPDFSHLGEYSETPGPDDRTIDRRARGDQGPNEYRYFVATHGPDETGNPDSVEQDYQRLETHGSEWSHVGLRAVATLSVCGVRQTIKSGGLWSVATNSGNEYLSTVATEELDALREILDALDLDAEDITPLWDSDVGPSGPLEPVE